MSLNLISKIRTYWQNIHGEQRVAAIATPVSASIVGQNQSGGVDPAVGDSISIGYTVSNDFVGSFVVPQDQTITIGSGSGSGGSGSTGGLGLIGVTGPTGIMGARMGFTGYAGPIGYSGTQGFPGTRLPDGTVQFLVTPPSYPSIPPPEPVKAREWNVMEYGSKWEDLDAID
jgi:hypothetical protein